VPVARQSPFTDLAEGRLAIPARVPLPAIPSTASAHADAAAGIGRGIPDKVDEVRR